MLRRIRSILPGLSAAVPLETPNLQVDMLTYPLVPPPGSRAFTLQVEPGDSVQAGQILATAATFTPHTALSGQVTACNDRQIQVKPSAPWPPESIVAPTTALTAAKTDYPAFLAGIGLQGMGGARFPAAIKCKSAHGQVETLVINGCECEPGVEIDQRLLLEKSEEIQAGARSYAAAVGATTILIAIRRNAGLAQKLREKYPDFKIKPCRRHYPAGAERLILQTLNGSLPPQGMLPAQLGFLIQNTASIHAVGNALLHHTPVLARPLSLIAPQRNLRRNLLLPLGISIGNLLSQLKIPFAPKQEKLILGGLMMGRPVSLETPVDPGASALFILNKKRRASRQSCIRCGACVDACPLGLHPILITQQLEKNRTDPATRIQANECFLCGCCEAVCPAHIPLAEILRTAQKKAKAQKTSS